MKTIKLLLLTLLSVLSFSSFSQRIVDVYVINQGGCPYALTDTYVSQSGAGNMTLTSIDSMGFQNVHHYIINDTVYPITLTICMYVGATQPPFPNQTPQCITQVLNSGTALTLVTDCSTVDVETYTYTPVKNILRVTDLSGKECELERNKYLIIHFDDGTCEKVYINN